MATMGDGVSMTGDRSGPGETKKISWESLTHSDRIHWPEGAFAFLAFLAWLFLFTGGTLIDTSPFRAVIGNKPPLVNPAPGWVVSWFNVLLFYLPINLAFLCVLSSMLGAFGNRVNLHADGTPISAQDRTSPYLSSLMRGFFVYLLMISGLLLLDEEPFTSPTQGQYIRLAGFLSLCGFIVSYQPSIFSSLVLVAFQRIRKPADENKPSIDAKTQVEVSRTSAVEVSKVVVDTTSLPDTVVPELKTNEPAVRLNEENPVAARSRTRRRKPV